MNRAYAQPGRPMAAQSYGVRPGGPGAYGANLGRPVSDPTSVRPGGQAAYVANLGRPASTPTSARPGIQAPNYAHSKATPNYVPRVASSPAAYARPTPQPAQYQPAAQRAPGGYARPTPQPAPAVQYAGGYGQAQVSPAPSSRGNAQIIAKIESLLATPETRGQLKHKVIKAFQHAVGTGEQTDINGLMKIRSELATKLGVPEAIFGSIRDEYDRFDFDGSGYLVVNEVYKLVKFHLYEYLVVTEVPDTIPQKTLRQAGYTVSKDLGAGNQGEVKLAVDKHGNQRCIKMVNKRAMGNMASLANMQEEFDTMERLTCNNIARTFEMFQDNNFIYMVNEVYLGKDLTCVEAEAKKSGVAVTEDWWREIFRQCFEALSFMHQQAMMHCDIKEPNIMLRTNKYQNPQAVLIDFGVSKAMTAKDDGTASGTPGYMPPETMNTGKWYPGGDIFSMGVVMIQLLTGKIPNEEKARQGITIGIFLEGARRIDDIKSFTSNRQPPYNEMPPQWPGVKQLCMRCLDTSMRTRPKAPTVLKDPWFGGAATAAQKKTPIEQAMNPTHALATVGITDEMMQQMPLATGKLSDVGVNMPAMGRPTPSAPVAQRQTPLPRPISGPAAYTPAARPAVAAARQAVPVGRPASSPASYGGAKPSRAKGYRS